MFSGQIYIFYVRYFTENDWNIDIKNIKIRREFYWNLSIYFKLVIHILFNYIANGVKNVCVNM